MHAERTWVSQALLSLCSADSIPSVLCVWMPCSTVSGAEAVLWQRPGNSSLILWVSSGVIKLACSDTLINNILIYFMGSLFFWVFLSLGPFSHILQLSSLFRECHQWIQSIKLFPTCGSHLLVVSLFYWTAHGVYISSAVTGLIENCRSLTDVRCGP